ncbi:hypothetical protein CEXT_78531 [Caerostris extrusa]|uniref:Uncharacterized protein n=1 Tax=Caerostris extrusa TaxID=172846 RepID=A0AAV4YAV0_CAEEX|nr:hypothetical protein CEXT_78531 [Caerostris extrusa]
MLAEVKFQQISWSNLQDIFPEGPDDINLNCRALISACRHESDDLLEGGGGPSLRAKLPIAPGLSLPAVQSAALFVPGVMRGKASCLQQCDDYQRHRRSIKRRSRSSLAFGRGTLPSGIFWGALERNPCIRIFRCTHSHLFDVKLTNFLSRILIHLDSVVCQAINSQQGL